MSLHSTCLPVAHEDEDLCLFTYSINSCIRPLALSCKRLYCISGMNVINDICICVLHLKLWMLALIQGLALQSQGSFPLQRRDLTEGETPRDYLARWLHIRAALAHYPNDDAIYH